MKSCQKKLAERYEKKAKVPTTAWSSVLQVDLEQIYTRLSWVKEEQTTAGSSQMELSHYTEIFTEKTKKRVAAKRILVQGETGIGKTTFVKKLLVDWLNLEQEKMDEERNDALKRFHLVLCINLKEVSKCQTFKEMISRSRLFAEDDEKSVDDLLCYIGKNQEKVLLVFDGYDEYRTGNEAEKNGSRSNSPFYEIFHGNILRDCTVLVTTRTSRADEIRGPADIQTEITGFNMSDRKDFMRKMLDSQTEVDGLLTFLRTSGIGELARVPLLALFFCLLWKEEKEKLMDLTERKAKLYQAIVKHILRHSHRRHSSSKGSELKETDYEEILAEIGKVALVGLLKGDLVFEFGQLPEKVRDEEGVIVGLFQFSEDGPSLAPMEMVSFIHKSIQEYLAAWYLIYSCVPEGNLGEIGQRAVRLEGCEAMENVFQFVCGLSDEGAIKVLQHLTSVRISDPTLNFSKTIPDIETETVMPLCDITCRHKRFSNLVYDSFRQVQSRAELLRHFLDCTGRVILVSRDRPLSKLMPDVKVLTKLVHNCVFSLISMYEADSVYDYFPFLHNDECSEGSVLYKSLEFLNCLQMPLRITESSEVLTAEEFMRTFRQKTLFAQCCCFFRSSLYFLEGQFQFYITKLVLQCDDHARLFTEPTTISVPSDAASLCSQRSCLKFLTSLRCHDLNGQTCTMKALGAVIGNCKYLSRIEVSQCDDSMCYLLEQVHSASKCSVKIDTCYYTSPGAVQLASLLPRFNDVTSLVLDLRGCCAAALDTLVSNITHRTLEKLILDGIILTPAATKALGRSLPQMSSLQVLGLTGVDGSILQVEDMEALFGGLKRTLPLLKLTFNNFSSRGCLATLCKCFHFFPILQALKLDRLNMNECDQCSVLESLRFIRSPRALRVQIEHCWAEGLSLHFLGFNPYEYDSIRINSPSPAVATALGRSLPEMLSLQKLELNGVNGNVLQAEDMEALFGGLNKTMPLCELSLLDFSAKGCLAPLFRRFRYFPNLVQLGLVRVGLDEHDLRGLLESFQFIPNLQELALIANHLGHTFVSIVPHITNLLKLQCLTIDKGSHSEEDLNYVVDTVSRALPEVLLCVQESDI